VCIGSFETSQTDRGYRISTKVCAQEFTVAIEHICHWSRERKLIGGAPQCRQGVEELDLRRPSLSSQRQGRENAIWGFLRCYSHCFTDTITWDW